MGAGPSPAEVAARIVAGLINLTESRAQLVGRLGERVAQAVAELDPDGLRRDTSPWPLGGLDSVDRLRFAFDSIRLLEVHTGAIVGDLRGMFAMQPVGSPARPVGYTLGGANTALMAAAVERAGPLVAMARAERVLKPRLAPATSKGLRAGIRAFDRGEQAAHAEHVRFAGLLTGPVKTAS